MCEDPEPDRARQPLDRLTWVPRTRLVPNPYNPNHMAPPERALLTISLLETGWTQPIVVFDRGDGMLEIVDGENRWRTSAEPAIAALTDGLVPVVILEGALADRMIATVRHNRARGVHGVVPMADIVKGLLAEGLTPAEIERRLQMEDEEVDRLSERAGVPEVAARTVEGFSAGWVPGHE